MNITHICLTGPFTDNWNYQENLLTKYHQKNGNNVNVITSKWIWGEDGKLKKDERNTFFNKDNVKIIRIELKGKDTFNKKIKTYYGLTEKLSNTKPDIIFVHGCQFIDINKIAKYAKINPKTKIFVDNHADYSNSATNWLSKNLLHKIIWRRCAQIIEPYTSKFYGVLPARVNFLIKIYNIQESKVELLLMGADDERVEETRNPEVKEKIRNKHNIRNDDFLIMTGGKIDNSKKQTLQLMQAIKNIPDNKVKLIVFGSVIPELQDKVNLLADGNKIQYIGWLKSEDSYKYFSAADLVVFPGRHSVLWEQVAGQGIPMVLKWWEGTTHVDLGGNVVFLKNDASDNIKKIIYKIYSNPDIYSSMLKASKEGQKLFSYKEIAERSISN